MNLSPIERLLAGCVLILIGGFAPLHSQALHNYRAGARSLALSHASVSFSDLWSVFHNQAGLASIKGVNAGAFFQSEFGIRQLSLAAGAVTLSAGEGTFGLSFYRFGPGSYHEDKLGIAYSRTFSKSVRAGIQLDYFSILFPENDQPKGFATFEAGLICVPSSNVNIGIHVFNPLSAGIEWTEGKQNMPLIIRAGGHWSFNEALLLAMEAETELHNPVVVKSGVEFKPAGNFVLRAGVSGKPVKYTAGMGFITDVFAADIGFGYHGNLGITPSVSVQIFLR